MIIDSGAMTCKRCIHWLGFGVEYCHIKDEMKAGNARTCYRFILAEKNEIITENITWQDGDHNCLKTLL